MSQRRRRLRMGVLFGVLFVLVVGITVILLALTRDNSGKRTKELLARVYDETEIGVQELGFMPTSPGEDGGLSRGSLIDVDFTNLLRMNREVKGWVQIDGTGASYPFVQHEDNEFYQNHSLDQSQNTEGWIFLDTRGNADLSGNHNILYALGRPDSEMFAGVRRMLEDGWLANRGNFNIKTSTPKKNNLWRIFAVYYTTSSESLETPGGLEELEQIAKRSVYDFQINLEQGDQVIAVTVRMDGDKNLVIYAKLAE